MFKTCEPENLKEKYPAADTRGLELLKKMLCFNPSDRISAREALENQYFDEVRLKEQEVFERCQIDLSFIDKCPEGELSDEELKELIIKYIEQHSQNSEEAISNFIEMYLNQDEEDDDEEYE